MATLSTAERANLMALELISRQIVQLTYAVASNAAGSGPTPPPAPRPAEPARRNLLARATDLLVGRFTALLGPLATLGTYLSAPTSGLSVFNKAIGLFAASIAPLLLPVLFTLAVGLAAAGDVIFRKLVPSLEAFDRAVLSVGIPAVVQLAETCGRAADALAALSKTPLADDVKAATGASASSWLMSAVNPLGKILESRTATRTLFAPLAIAESRTATTAAFPALAIARRLFGTPDGGPGGPGGPGAAGGPGGPGGAGAGGPGAIAAGATGARGTTRRAMDDVLRELMLSMGPRVSVGTPSSVWSRAQTAAMGQSPFERRMLEMMTTVVGTLTRAAGPGTPGRDPWAERVPGGGVRGGIPGAGGRA